MMRAERDLVPPPFLPDGFGLRGLCPKRGADIPGPDRPDGLLQTRSGAGGLRATSRRRRVCGRSTTKDMLTLAEASEKSFRFWASALIPRWGGRPSGRLKSPERGGGCICWQKPGFRSQRARRDARWV